ncbi:unnamed protein product [Effrenium voratum]|nr:unnamed protein product [Effrenium voratum]
MAPASPPPWLGQLGYRYQGVQFYNDQQWFTFEFPNHPSKLYVANLPDWSQTVYEKIRLVDTGGIDYWQGGVHYWHSKVLFLPEVEDGSTSAGGVEVSFGSLGRRLRGAQEEFDYSQVEIKKAWQLHAENWGDESWYNLQHTARLASPMSYDSVVRKVAEMAWEYPFFTWDEAGTYQKLAEAKVRECHCRIFADRLLESVASSEEVAALPKDMDCGSRLPQTLRAARAKVAPSQGCCPWLWRLTSRLKSVEQLRRESEPIVHWPAACGVRQSLAGESVKPSDLPTAQPPPGEHGMRADVRDADGAAGEGQWEERLACAQSRAARVNSPRPETPAQRGMRCHMELTQAMVSLQQRRRDHEERLQWLQLQVLRAEVSEMEESDAAAQQRRREALLRREARQRRVRLEQQRRAQEEREAEERRRRRAACEEAAESQSLATLHSLQQQLAAEKQRANARRAALQGQLLQLRAQRAEREEAWVASSAHGAELAAAEESYARRAAEAAAERGAAREAALERRSRAVRKLETLEFAVREMRAAEEVELANLELADGSVSGLQGFDSPKALELSGAAAWPQGAGGGWGSPVWVLLVFTKRDDVQHMEEAATLLLKHAAAEVLNLGDGKGQGVVASAGRSGGRADASWLHDVEKRCGRILRQHACCELENGRGKDGFGELDRGVEVQRCAVTASLPAFWAQVPRRLEFAALARHQGRPMPRFRLLFVPLALGPAPKRRRPKRAAALALVCCVLLSACAFVAAAQPPAPRGRIPFAKLCAVPASDVALSGLDARDVDFMERLRGLAAEVLALPNLTAHQRLVWVTSLRLDAVPVQELPPWFWERMNVTRRPPGVDLLSLDGQRAIRCCAEALEFPQVRRFLRLARWVYKASDCMLVTNSTKLLSPQSTTWLRRSKARRRTMSVTAAPRPLRSGASTAASDSCNAADAPLRRCQRDCLEACAKGARVIEMACGTGKTRVIKELVGSISGRVLITVPLRALLDQFAQDFPEFCKVGTGYNAGIDYNAKGFLAVTDSVPLLAHLEFDAVFVDEAHHPLPKACPKTVLLYRFSATHQDEPDFRYSMGQAMEDAVLCDYDLTVPLVTPLHGHTYLSLADLLLKQAGRFRRVLAYCNSIREARNFRMVLQKLGLAAWHMNGLTKPKKRQEILDQFAGTLQKPVHVLLTVEVLGEGINIPNADTCMFVEPRSSYRSIVQAIGRVLRPHPTKPLAHIILPGVLMPTKGQKVSQPAMHPTAGLFDGDKALVSHKGIAASPVDKHDQEAALPDPVREDAELLLRFGGDAVEGGKPHCVQARKNAGAHHLAQRERRDFHETDLNCDQSLPSRDMAGSETSSTAHRRKSNGRRESVGGVAGSVLTLDHHDGRRAIREAGDVEVMRNKQVAAGGPTADRTGSMANGVGLDPRRAAGLGAGLCAGNQGDSPASPPFVPRDGGSPQIRTQRAELKVSKGNEHPRRGMQMRTTADGHEMTFGSELQRFLACLTQADYRLAGLGEKPQHRIQIADCTTFSQSHLGMAGATRAVYAELAAVLLYRDPWELRFGDLERFVKRNGRLPSQLASHMEEKSLGIWRKNQARKDCANRMPPHRLHKFLNTSVTLIRAWAKGLFDPKNFVRQRCKALRANILARGALPRLKSRNSESRGLAKWLYNSCRRGIALADWKWKMLEEVHPLVKAKLHSWKNTTIRIKSPAWHERLHELSDFVSRNDRLPSGGSLRNWIVRQRNYLQRGVLPSEFVLQLKGSHRLISSYVQAPSRKARGV